MAAGNKIYVGTDVRLWYTPVSLDDGLPVEPDEAFVAVFVEDEQIASGAAVWHPEYLRLFFDLDAELVTQEMFDQLARFEWSMTIDSHPVRDVETARVREAIVVSPVLYSGLNPEAQAIIEEVKARFNDLTDNDHFGPYLEEVANLDDERYAVLLKHAIQRINSVGAVTKRYTLDSFPFARPLGEGLARVALQVETVKHLITSYTEDSDKSSVGSPAVDRRDYSERWRSVLTGLAPEFDDFLRAFDRDLMNLGRTSALIDTRQFPFGFADRVRPSLPPWWRHL